MAEVAKTVERKMPLVKPYMVSLQGGGHLWQIYRVVLPADAVMQDLNTYPEMLAGHKFRQDDTLRVVAFDRSWCVEVSVIESSPGRVVVSKAHVLWSGKDGRTGVEYEDANYEAEWSGSWYSVYRKGTGNRPRVKVADGLATIGAVKAAVAKLYPVKVT